ncbi:MAG TPA: hypothetical protein VD793_11250 [Gemmatimonadales bacterium]|nr:hypothetical protein [Gemmatimonadales bacterium]
MRSRMQVTLAGLLALSLPACDDLTGPDFAPPANLTYRLEPSGDPEAPASLVLYWDEVTNDRLEAYRVYSRASQAAQFDLRATTTSTTFHDAGVPDLEYHVTAQWRGGKESDPSDVVLIDERLRLEAPAWLLGTSLNRAIHLSWSDNPFLNEPEGFRQYRVYSTSYSLDDNECGETWSVEGTTVAPEFLAGALANGVPRCFGVSAESVEGWESLWAPVTYDTPRPDARNVLMYPYQADVSRSGFRFFLDANGDGQAGPLELGVVTSGDRTDIDFWIDRDVSGNLFLVPERAGTEVALYRTDPIEDLTSINIAPTSGYARSAIQAVPGFGYVFQMSGGDGFARFGGLRVTHASASYVIFDWSYQTDPGNPELRIHGGLPVAPNIVVVPPR